MEEEKDTKNIQPNENDTLGSDTAENVVLEDDIPVSNNLPQDEVKPINFDDGVLDEKDIDASSNDISSNEVGDLINEFGFKLKPEGIDYPQIDPVIFELGPLAVRWYSLAYLFGIILGWLYIKYLNRRFYSNPISEKAIESIPVWMILSIIIGGRLGYVFFYNLDYYSYNAGEILKVWKGGMSFHGGLFGVIIGLYFFSKVHKVSFFKITDLMAAATPIGLFLGRIANFINAELIGRKTDVDWGVIYPDEYIKRHPSQIYEAILEGFVLFLIILLVISLFKALKKPGVVSGIFLAGYGAFRFISEFYRQPDAQLGFLYNTEWLTMGMVLSVPLMIVGFVIFVISLMRSNRGN